jgi:hypothetical protein
MSRTARRGSSYLDTITSHRRQLARGGQLRAVAHIGPNHEHMLELSHAGAIGSLVLTRQNIVEARRALDAFEAVAERADDHEVMFPRAEKVVF